jgi:hypothetical protein
MVPAYFIALRELFDNVNEDVEYVDEITSRTMTTIP